MFWSWFSSSVLILFCALDRSDTEFFNRLRQFSEDVIRARVLNLVMRPLKIVTCAAKFIANSSLLVRLGAVGTT